jgi:hypothetical protein
MILHNDDKFYDRVAGAHYDALGTNGAIYICITIYIYIYIYTSTHVPQYRFDQELSRCV